MHCSMFVALRVDLYRGKLIENITSDLKGT